VKVGGKVGEAKRKAEKDMTWGGRPDPAPEAVVGIDVNAGFFAAPWRFNKPTRSS
jgi:hypothetical protein